MQQDVDGPDKPGHDGAYLMCIACELGLWMAMDDLPAEPPPGFPRAKPADDAVRFACDAPQDAPPAREAQPPEDERAP